MAFSALEKALAVAVGIDLAVPGTNRKVALAIAKQIPRVSPPVARGALGVGRAALGAGATLARRNPVAATGLGALALQRAGAFDPIEDAIQMEVERRTQDIMAPIELARQPVVQRAAGRVAKRKVSKYGKAIKAGIAAVKKSKFGGKPGKITNAKTTFSTVSKVTAAINKGKKVSAKGIRGTVARAVRGILK
tara:strand:- start:457 stop:1032 length:576 start_codon:yes stop_codon:yes gene_type:complete